MGPLYCSFSLAVLTALTLALPVDATTLREQETESDTAAIRSLTQQAKDAFVARDWDRFADFFTQDAVWMPPNMLPLVGRQAWSSWANGWWDRATVDEMEVVNEEIVIAGDWAFERHKETQVTTSKGSGETNHRYYKGIWIFRRQPDSSWKIARYIWNGNPAPDGTN